MANGSRVPSMVIWPSALASGWLFGPPARGDEDETVDSIGMLVGELDQGDATKRVADERHSLEPDLVTVRQ